MPPPHEVFQALPFEAFKFLRRNEIDKLLLTSRGLRKAALCLVAQHRSSVGLVFNTLVGKLKGEFRIFCQKGPKHAYAQSSYTVPGGSGVRIVHIFVDVYLKDDYLRIEVCKDKFIDKHQICNPHLGGHTFAAWLTIRPIENVMDAFVDGRRKPIGPVPEDLFTYVRNGVK